MSIKVWFIVEIYSLPLSNVHAKSIAIKPKMVSRETPDATWKALTLDRQT